ncbi:hypothetical protein PRIPAC_77061 [Pristionchus pacificus]|uniref:Uncharacterized protein n=1 Tax=Pristionchus pacificus TaxID=54126 RepID=A0A2A6BY61_PRIPA|nr:hypothetical protein PRIPAC_77061 [Pristionchus pacificus]|eukprot:PDM70845.1 hypothetical protein PRIPAC_45049 [Pristionchus pacificus]
MKNEEMDSSFFNLSLLSSVIWSIQTNRLDKKNEIKKATKRKSNADDEKSPAVKPVLPDPKKAYAIKKK